LLKRQELGLGEFEPDTPSVTDQIAMEKWQAEQAGGAPQTTAEKRLAFDERKYNDLVAKEAAGTPLTDSEKLAREKWEFEKNKKPAMSSTDRNIERLMEANPDMSRSEAINIEQGVISKTVDPTTGRIQTTNIATNQSTPVESTAPLPNSTLNLEPLAKGESLFERGQKYTGAIEAGLRGAQKVAGQFGGQVASDESLQTKQELEALQGSLSRAFQSDQRFSTYADKLIRKELDATLGAMKDPQTFKNNAISLDKVMRQRHADLMRQANELTYDSDFRADSHQKASVLEAAIRDLGVTQEVEGGQAVAATMPEGINPKFTQELWDTLTPEERATLPRNAK
jgi:hypothetical protein